MDAVVTAVMSTYDPVESSAKLILLGNIYNRTLIEQKNVNVTAVCAEYTQDVQTQNTVASAIMSAIDNRLNGLQGNVPATAE